MLAEVRLRFWILRARQLLKKILHHCGRCHRFRMKAMSAPVAPIPQERITKAHPFHIVGVDFAGPLYVKAGKGTTKVYIAVFTRAVVRAIHLELVTELSAESFLLALRRFIAQRGMPQVVYSDNAAAFKRASKEIQDLHRVIGSVPVQDHLSTNRIQ